MAKRYYYDCALEAAYMAKRFGMKFHSPANDEYAEEIYLDPQDILNADTCGDYKDSIFIYPDSLPILEPQVGDVWKREKEGKKLYYQCTRSDEVIEFRGLNTFDEAFLIEHIMYPIFMKTATLIERGKPFFWPKEEQDG